MGLTQQELDRRLGLAREFFEAIPHGKALGLEVIAYEHRILTAMLPFRPELVGNPYTGRIHGGAITTLIDQTCGTVTVCALPEPEPIATLDLRVDHLRPAEPGQPVYARAECYRITREIAFTRCVCYQSDPADPIASSMSTFMRTGRGNMTRGGQ